MVSRSHPVWGPPPVFAKQSQLAASKSVNMATIISRNPRSPDKGRNSTDATNGSNTSKNVVCRHKDCPLYKAPPCLYRCVQESVSTRSCYGTKYPDWKTFTRYFEVNVPVGEEGAIRYWARDHLHRDEHTVQSVLDFAKECGHLPLLNQLEKLIKGNPNVGNNQLFL